ASTRSSSWWPRRRKTARSQRKRKRKRRRPRLPSRGARNEPRNDARSEDPIQISEQGTGNREWKRGTGVRSRRLDPSDTGRRGNGNRTRLGRTARLDGSFLFFDLSLGLVAPLDRNGT